MTSPYETLKTLNRRATDPDEGRGPYTEADSVKIAAEITKEAGLLSGGLRAAEKLLWTIPEAVGGLMGGAAARTGAGKAMAGAAHGAAQGAANVAEGGLQSIWNAGLGPTLIGGFAVHDLLGKADQLKRMGQVVKSRGPSAPIWKPRG